MSIVCIIGRTSVLQRSLELKLNAWPKLCDKANNIMQRSNDQYQPSGILSWVMNKPTVWFCSLVQNRHDLFMVFLVCSALRVFYWTSLSLSLSNVCSSYDLFDLYFCSVSSFQVIIPIMKWEATAFGRPMLALTLVASLALFPVFFIPSGPSMWLAGMIFGYGLGFVIIMVGTTIGMVLPYLIGLLFRDRIHVRPYEL